MRIARCEGTKLPSRERFTYYEADFAGIHFSRIDIADLKHWVRVAAKHRYGKDSQVIFLTTDERI